MIEEKDMQKGTYSTSESCYKARVNASEVERKQCPCLVCIKRFAQDMISYKENHRIISSLLWMFLTIMSLGIFGR